jgi:hypothetical protein
MHHTIAWFKDLVTATETDVTPVTDGIFTIQNSHFLPQRNWNLWYAAFMAATATRARLRTPTFRQITTPFIRPIEGTITPGDEPNVADYRENPLLLKGLEEIEFLGTQTAGANANVFGVAGLSTEAFVPMPRGDVYTLRGTSVGPAVANVWTQIAMTWQDTLPQGIFAVVGGWYMSAAAVAFRLIFEDQVNRPGGLGALSLEASAHKMFRMGGLGIWGRFNSNRMPNVEVLCNGADASFELYLDILRVG